MDKKISIVLPVYNGSAYISDSINSILAQTYTNWELIIVDDCSTDKTPEIINHFRESDSRIIICTNERNLGLPNALNAGFSLASGDYYTWTSDDNLYLPGALEKMINVLEKEPDILMVYADYSMVDPSGNIIIEMKLPESQYIVTGNICGACFLYRSDAAKQAGTYDPETFLAEDYDYWIRIYKQGNIRHLSENLYLYRMHPNSLTSTKQELIKKQAYKVMEKHFLFFYENAGENNLLYDFFDGFMNVSTTQSQKTYKILTSMNKGYDFYCKKRQKKNKLSSIKARLKRIIRQ